MKRATYLITGCAVAGMVLTSILVRAPATAAKEPPPAQQQATPPQQAVPAENLNLQNPRAAQPVKVADPTPFTSKDGKRKGWKIVIPGGKPLATPAILDGKVFIGGGFGSHEFYAFDAATGKKVWQYQTADDGPTAAVVDEEYVAFNTESCELEILALDGKPLWKKWLGDPLMSMPAIAQGKLYMAYPDSKGGGQYQLACFDVKDGKENWKKPITGEIITAPILSEGQVYVATLEGTLLCLKQNDGELVWKEKKNTTSAPVVFHNQCYFSRREETTVAKDGKKVKQQTEQVASRGNGSKGETRDMPATARPADYLDYAKRSVSPVEQGNQGKDAGVGFAGTPSGGKGAFQTGAAQANIAQSSVAGVWSYQGSKPFVYKDRLYSAMGDTVQCVDPKTEKVLWKKDLRKKDKDKGELLDSVLTPPALVNDKVFLGTTYGEVVCLNAQTGDLLWTESIGEPVVFQPAVANGRVYVSTDVGSLYCLETGDDKDDGWFMWGGNAAHNGQNK